jgi:bifunctional DNA-binding transcriptional regulator/antitoxin component of YhaV-PrlF toxin-antitoxin module
MVAVKVSAKGEVTIPKAILDSLGVSGEGCLRLVAQPDGRVLMELEPRGAVGVQENTSGGFRRLIGMAKTGGPPISVEEMEAAIAEAINT